MVAVLACSQTAGGRFASRMGLPDSAHARNAGVEDLVPVLFRVAAVHGAAREVDHDVRPVDRPGPISLRAAEDDDLVAVCTELSGEQGADLSGTAWDYDLHRLSLHAARYRVSFERVQEESTRGTS